MEGERTRAEWKGKEERREGANEEGEVHVKKVEDKGKKKKEKVGAEVKERKSNEIEREAENAGEMEGNVGEKRRMKWI